MACPVINPNHEPTDPVSMPSGQGSKNNLGEHRVRCFHPTSAFSGWPKPGRAKPTLSRFTGGFDEDFPGSASCPTRLDTPIGRVYIHRGKASPKVKVPPVGPCRRPAVVAMHVSPPLFAGDGHENWCHDGERDLTSAQLWKVQRSSLALARKRSPLLLWPSNGNSIPQHKSSMTDLTSTRCLHPDPSLNCFGIERTRSLKKQKTFESDFGGGPRGSASMRANQIYEINHARSKNQFLSPPSNFDSSSSVFNSAFISHQNLPYHDGMSEMSLCYILKLKNDEAKGSRYVRVVKETDLKSVGLRPRRFEPCCRRPFLP
ncbi:hypothetical protein NL676_000763 [Syzygium grande]|nr:hypothetical protein NL676_000763 [Syzygium grande]